MDAETFIETVQQVEGIDELAASSLYELLDAYDAIKKSTRHDYLWVKVGDPDGRVVSDNTLKEVRDALSDADLPFEVLVTGWDLHPEAYEDAEELLEHVEREVKQV